MKHRKSLLKFLIGSLLSVGVPVIARGDTTDDSTAFFENEVRPVLVSRCIQCHGPKKSESGLRLDSLAAATKGGDSGAAIIPGKPDESLVVQAILQVDGLEMPPNSKLPEREIEVLVRWIRAGATWPKDMKLAGKGPRLRGGPITPEERQFWSFQAVTDPVPPAADTSHAVRNDIDHFVLAMLREQGLTPQTRASKRVLVRRASFDLTGLPPTSDEINAFLNDDSPDAFGRLVDRLLESRQYGERWGRHWLDVVRYADTAGETGDYPTPLSYKYRNWVIDAFNRDKPYDQFVREQVAGDILARQRRNVTDEEYRDLLTATGFIAISRRFGFDVENYHHLTIQDTIDTLGQSVLGLSLGCARCHDHKYDPVNTDDYYAWYGILESTKYSFPGSEEKKRPYDIFPAVPPQLATQRKSDYDLRLAEIDKQIQVATASQQAAEDKLKQGESSGEFYGCETLTVGQPLPKSWGVIDDVQVEAKAQSPFVNVFAKGSRGLTMPSNSANNAFIRRFEAHTGVTTPLLHYNIDFRLNSVADNGTGAFRFYLGRGPGNSAAVELSASAQTFYVKSGDAYVPIRDLEIGKWYNLQVVADLRSESYSGSIGTLDDRTSFDNKQFTTGWDGTIDCTFVDKFGQNGGTIPARSFDNLSITTTPHLPVRTPVEDHPDHLASSRWQAAIESRRLVRPGQDRDGHTGLVIWDSDPLPLVAVNTSEIELKVPGVVSPGKLVVHPNPKEGVGIGWRSPISGRIRVSGNIQDAHDCGDSVTWHLDHLSHRGFTKVVEGATERNGSQSLPNDVLVDVEVGEFVQLAVMPKSHHGCDLTQVDLRLVEVDGEERTWDLVADVGGDLLAGNPNSDQYGNGVWYFYRVAEDRGASQSVERGKPLSLAEGEKAREELEAASQELTRLATVRSELVRKGPYELIYGAIEKDDPHDAQIRIRGDRDKLGDVVPRKNLEILGGERLTMIGESSSFGSGRRDLANWLTRPENALTPRVMANRIWQQHFGRGLVATENDFGARGTRPTHPELLDWLATRFVESGWSVKQMHRLIMNSATYQQSSEYDAMAVEKDPEAKYLWRFNRRRLSAEEIRDAMLLVSGDLDPSQGGEHPFPAVESWGFTQHTPYYGIYPSNRRSIYLMQQRLKRHPFLSLFDGADVNVSTARRELTTVPTQSLFLMNSEFIHQRSMNLAKRLASENAPERRAMLLFEAALGRLPDKEERPIMMAFIAEYQESVGGRGPEAELQAWAAFARSVLTRNEFLFVD